MSAAPDISAKPHHARLMDANYAMQRHIYDVTRKYYLLGRDRLIRNLAVPDGGHVLELGCGTARNIVVAAGCYLTAHFYGLDISEEMLKSAQKNTNRHGVAGRCVLAQGDATDFDAANLWGRTQFDRVFCSYTLSMIPGWEKAIALGCGLLAPGGELHIVDFGEQDDLPKPFRKFLTTWLAQFHVTPRVDLFAVSERLASEHGLICQTQPLYRDYARAVVIRNMP
ncbi:MAG: class I SAM-dependent methyltransferase [Sphingobium sp.]|nr:class I SAM-dependent methyltransferase [Sphingobium sp.]